MKKIGRCGLLVSEIGLGGRWLSTQGKQAGDPEVFRRVLEAARKAGINHIDTAAGYGDSEKVIGDFMKASGWRPIVSSKVWSHDEGKIRAGVENSLKNLGLERIPLYLIHNPEDTEKALPVFRRLREEGLIGAVGICGWHGDEDRLLRMASEGTADVLQIALTLAHRGMLQRGVVDYALRNNLGIQVMSPMAKGLLSGPHPALEPLKDFGILTLEQATLKFLVDHLPNGVPLPGTSKPERIAAFASVMGKPVIPPELWKEVLGGIDADPELKKLP